MPYYDTLSIFLCSLCLLLTNTNGITNTQFNANIRDYSTNESISNWTNVKTLQKEDKGRYANFAPLRNPEALKEIPNDVLSSSSNSRGLLHHEVPGYVIGDYEEVPHYGHGYDYHSHDDHHDPHSYKHYYAHHDSGYHHYPGHHHLDYGHHYKYHNHPLAAKTLLWPIAGIALLGAAAALANNPVLLQLGVLSGRRKRNTEEISTEYNTPDLKIWTKNDSNEQAKEEFKKRMLKWYVFKDVKHGVSRNVTRNTGLQTSTKNNYKIIPNSNINDDDRFIPIPLKFKARIIE